MRETMVAPAPTEGGVGMRSSGIFSRSTFAIVGLVSVVLGVVGIPAASAHTSGTAIIGQFEIEGNIADDSGPGDPIDWTSTPPPPNLTNFTDTTGSADDIFGQGSKELAPGGWKCITGSAPSKDDIKNGQISFRTVGGKQFVYVNYTRFGVNGDAHMDYEFNQSTARNPACPDLPVRTAGDLLITYDTENGGRTIVIRAFTWRGTAQSGTFDELPLGARGVIFDGAVNIPNTIPGLEAGAYGEAAINLTDSPIGEIGCDRFATAYMKTRASTAINSEIKDRTAVQPILTFPIPDPAGAKASDSAFGAQVKETLLGIDQTLVPVRSSQAGVGTNSQSDQVLNVRVPATGETLKADVLRTSSTSSVTASPAQADHLSTAEAANVNLLNGFVTASAVRGVASTNATGSSASFSSAASALMDLAVGGVAHDNVAPNTRIELPPALFGEGSYVVLYERIGSTSRPPAGQLEGGTYAADLTVNMIRVHVTDRQPPVPGAQAVDIIVAQAKAHSDFPQLFTCPGAPRQSVSGHAFVTSEATSPAVPPARVGYVDIPATGGHDHQHLNTVNGTSVRSGAADSDSSGTLSSSGATASSSAQAANVCLLPGSAGCTVGAEVVKSQSNSSASAGGASSNDTGTSFVGVSALGTPTSVGTARNQTVELPGLGFVIFNEQFCDNGATLPNCADGNVAGHAGLTIRAIRLVVTVPGNPSGLAAGTQVIVAEAHSDARQN